MQPHAEYLMGPAKQVQLDMNEFYNTPYESYMTATPLSTVLNSTFDQLQYNITLNDHDSLFHLWEAIINQR